MAEVCRLASNLAPAATSEVQLWGCFVDDARDRTQDEALLDESELARAQRFRFARDRARFVHRHAYVRRVLARYLDTDPAAVAIRTIVGGKPELDAVHNITFSVSQADDLTVITVAQDRPVGIDVERMRAIDDAVEIAAGNFAQPEVDLLRSLPRASRGGAFLKLWTRKESFVKAVGTGLSMPLDSFVVVDQDDGGVARPHRPAGAMPFIISPIETPRGYVGAVTLQGDRISLREMERAGAVR